MMPNTHFRGSFDHRDTTLGIDADADDAELVENLLHGLSTVGLPGQLERFFERLPILGSERRSHKFERLHESLGGGGERLLFDPGHRGPFDIGSLHWRGSEVLHQTGQTNSQSEKASRAKHGMVLQGPTRVQRERRQIAKRTTINILG